MKGKKIQEFVKHRQYSKYKIGWKECIVMGILVTGALFALWLQNKNYVNTGEKCTGASTTVWEEMQGERSPQENTTAYKGKIALTFDDGPHPYYTEQLLDGLKVRGIRATFFVTGEHAQLHQDVILRMKEEGHLIGNHTYSHMQLTDRNREEFKEQLIKTNNVITKITGEEVLYVRPPYGTWDKAFENELNMFPVMWSVDSLDWCSDNASCVTKKVVDKIKENDIILMHDYYATSVTAALAIVDELLTEGYEFVTVEEILFD